MTVEPGQSAADIESRSSEAGSRRPKDSPIADHSPGRPIVVLLHLSGNEESARAWAAREFQGFTIEPMPKSLLKWGSKRQQLRRIREIGPDAFAVFTADLTFQTARQAIIAFGGASGAKQVVLGDANGQTLRKSGWSALLLSPIHLTIELLAGYLTLVPFAWLFTAMVSFYCRLRNLSWSEYAKHAPNPGPTFSVLYLRGSLASAGDGKTAGGMSTHVKGFTEGALSLGHQLSFVCSTQPDLPPQIRDIAILRPSATFSATRAMFEVWNSMLFTRRTLRSIGSRPSFDFIYQRYNRFNCTGVVLAVLTRIPLILEYNGSEIWVGRHWDPIGLTWLLRIFERINQRFAHLIVVVSEAEKRNLLAAGVAEDRIIVNPNGVDPKQFRPGAGGADVRRRLGIDDKIVVGFIGTFGPWHGAEVLARAAIQLDRRDRFHLLFVGDGDLSPPTRSVFSSEGCPQMATFTGRVQHDLAPAYLDACDILVSPHVPSTDGTEFFGSPTKLFEYLASGKPVVASRLGQIGDIIDDGETGLLVEPGNAEQLARAIERLADDALLRQKLGANGRAMVASRFTWRQNAARIFDAFQQRLVKQR